MESFYAEPKTECDEFLTWPIFLFYICFLFFSLVMFCCSHLFWKVVLGNVKSQN